MKRKERGITSKKNEEALKKIKNPRDEGVEIYVELSPKTIELAKFKLNENE